MRRVGVHFRIYRKNAQRRHLLFLLIQSVHCLYCFAHHLDQFYGGEGFDLFAVAEQEATRPPERFRIALDHRALVVVRHYDMLVAQTCAQATVTGKHWRDPVANVDTSSLAHAGIEVIAISAQSAGLNTVHAIIAKRLHVTYLGCAVPPTAPAFPFLRVWTPCPSHLRFPTLLP